MIVASDATIPAIVSVAGLAGLAGLLVYHFWSMRKRTRDLRALAASLGFRFVGEAVPNSIRLARTALHSVSGASNAIEGERRGLQVMVFDCRTGTGRGTRTRTVFAIHAPMEAVEAFWTQDPNLSIEQAGEWTILFPPTNPGGPNSLTPVPRIAAHLQALQP